MFKKIFIKAIILSLFTNSVLANEIDTNIIKNDVDLLTRLTSTNIDSALIVAEKLESILPLLKKDKDGVRMCFIIQNQIAITYATRGDFIKSFEFFKMNTELDSSLLPAKNLGTSFNNLAIIYMDFGNYTRAIENYFIGLKYREKHGDKNEIAASYLNIGLCYYRQRMLDKALINYKLSEKYLSQAKQMNVSIQAKIYSNIGLIYLYKSKYDSAQANFDKAIQINMENNFKDELADCYNNYADFYFSQNDFSNAIKMAQKALKIHNETKNDYGINLSYVSLGKSYIALKNYSVSKQYLDSALQYFKIQQNLWEIKDIYELFAQHYNAQNNFKLASIYKDSLIQIKDSIFNEENLSQQKNTEAIYGSEKKALIIKNLEKENEITAIEVKKQNTLKLFFGIGFLLTLLLAIFIFRMYRLKRKSELMLSIQKNIVEAAHYELEQKNKEITDSINYAKRIQDAILPSPKNLNQSLKNGFVFYQPKDIVSGDFYWMETFSDIANDERENKSTNNKMINSTEPNLSLHRNEVILFAAADCTGHGVPGAMVSVICNNGLNRSVREYGISEPGKILDKAREIVIQEFEKSEEDVKDGMDIALCSLKFYESYALLKFAGANNPLWLIKNRELIEYKGNKQPIGKVDNPKPFTTHTIKLLQGDTIYIFTDGFADQFGGDKGKKFMYKPFKELLLSIQEKTMDEQKIVLEQHFKNWKGSSEQVDDVCVIGVKI